MKKILFIIFGYLLICTYSLANDSTSLYLNLDWWKNFNDEYLIENLQKVYENNYDLKNTELKIRANEQIVRMQFAQELPSVNFAGEISRDLQAARQRFGSMSIPNYSQNNFYLPITAGYEIDIWGKNRFKTKSKKEQLKIIEQAQRATYISLTSNFAIDYYNLIKADEMIKIQKELIEIQKDILSKTSEKYNAGLISVFDVLHQEKILNSLKEEENNYEKTKEVLSNTLKVYLADMNDDIKRQEFDNIILPDNIAQNFNSDIVEKRPDYLQQEANIKRIGFDVKVAKKEFLPSFTIFGQIGLNAYTLSSLCNSVSQFFAAGILPNMDLFSGGRKLAMLKMQKFRYEEALNDYQKTYLSAISEVNSSLFEYKTAIKNFNESNEKYLTEGKIYNLTIDKKEIGVCDDLNLLFAKEAYLSSKKELVSNKINSQIALIGLYKASGGVDLKNINNL